MPKVCHCSPSHRARTPMVLSFFSRRLSTLRATHPVAKDTGNGPRSSLKGRSWPVVYGRCRLEPHCHRLALAP